MLRGWKELRHPTADFDMWSYWCEHLDPTREDINPVVHYAVEGRRAGLSTLPRLETLPEPEPPGPDYAPRRVCLFAGYDGDGVIDDTVVAYLADLSRFADIYYLADCELADGELERIAPHTKGARGHPPRSLRLRLLLDAGQGARRLGRHRLLRRADARQ
ncbi:hypothetical protein [Nocardioides sp. B-3]|uniref:hypothetical protein n=1 Tax=Nocardioides sp. B-3 TaxID=2895565 RepID=UPI002153A3CA|nr:hypothetical protein [Nocardioides sp. B-3]UUZ60016.1 hypothetical protein LP418_03090 [Nocardioides sp. B-3]